MYRFVIVLFLSTMYAQLEINGTCDLTNIEPHTSISNQIADKWYQIERIPNSIEKGDCSQTTISFAFGNTTWSASKYDSEVVDGELVLRNASITPTSDPGVWNVTYHDGVSEVIVALGTDYVEYLMLYRCQDTGNSSATISAWKLGRNMSYRDSAYATEYTQILATNVNIANTTWQTVNHTEAACKLKGGAVNLQISPILLLLLGLIGIIGIIMYIKKEISLNKK